MKVFINNLDFIKTDIQVDFGNGSGFQTYSKSEAKSGISIPSDCSDWSKITVKANSSEINCLDVYKQLGSTVSSSGGEDWTMCYTADCGPNGYVGCIASSKNITRIEKLFLQKVTTKGELLPQECDLIFYLTEGERPTHCFFSRNISENQAGYEVYYDDGTNEILIPQSV